MDLTFFTISQPFVKHWKLAQENAIKTWKRLEPDKIILFGNDKGVKKAAGRLGCVHRKVLSHKRFGVPFISDAFDRAQREATSRIMCYLNCDIILMDDFAVAVDVIANRFKGDFLIIGQRFGWEIREPLDFSIDWQTQLWKRSRQRVKRKEFHGRGALDFFIFTRGLYGKIPNFLVGRGRWDLWLSSHIMYRRTVPVVDATRAVLVIHQDSPGGRDPHKKREEIEYNARLAHRARDVQKGLTSYATWELTEEMKLIKRRGVPKKEKYNPYENAM